MARAVHSRSSDRVRSRVGLVAALVVVVHLSSAGCAAPKPSVTDLRAEPILLPLTGEVVLLEGHAAPRRARIGVAPRDGAVERIVALAPDPAAVATDLQQRFDDRYRFRRTDLGAGSPNTVELRGGVAGGPDVIATASTRTAVPLFLALGGVAAAPPDRQTSLVVTVISRQ